MNRRWFADLPTSVPEIAAHVGAAVAIAGAGLLLGAWVATQYAAYRLGFHPALGAPLLVVTAPRRGLLDATVAIAAALGTVGLTTRGWRTPGGVLVGLTALVLMLEFWPLYAPLDFFVWWWQFGRHPDIADVWKTGTWIIVVAIPVPMVAMVIVDLVRGRSLNGAADAPSPARWATRRDVRSNLIGWDAGVVLGAWSARRRRRSRRCLRHDGPEHVLAFAPARSGKDVGLVHPTLLTWPRSTVVLDIKGEHWALTAGWRRQALDSRCVRFDPTAADGSAARFNPLFEVRPWPRDVRDAQLIATMLTDPDGRGPRDSWGRAARDLLVAIVLHALYADRDKSLHGCLTLLADPARPIDSTLHTMLRTLHDPSGTFGWKDGRGQATHTHPVVADAVRGLLTQSETDRARIVSSAIACLSVARDPVVALNTETSDFAVSDLRHHDRPLSLYLTVSPADIPRTRPLLRLLIHQIIRQFTETRDSGGEGADEPQAPRLLLMLDEFLRLGRIDGFQAALSYLPDYGIRAFLIVPDLTQLTLVYGGDHESVLANCRVRIAYAADTVETARFIAGMALRMTATKDPRRLSRPVALGVMASEPKSPRPLLTPDDVRHLPPDDALIFVTGCPPIYGKKIRLSLDPVFGARAKIPPPAESDRLVHDWSGWTARLAAAVPEVPAATAEPNETPPKPDLEPASADGAAPPIPPDEAF